MTTEQLEHRRRIAREWKSRQPKQWREKENAKKRLSRKLGLWKKNDKLKDQVRHIVRNAVRDGRLFKFPCFCGEFKTQGHHEDYSKPLDVIWLCAKHHNQLHRLKPSPKEK